MATPIRFDFDGLTRPIESGDTRYHLALDAGGAEVRIIDSDYPAGARGTAADMSSGDFLG